MYKSLIKTILIIIPNIKSHSIMSIKIKNHLQFYKSILISFVLLILLCVQSYGARYGWITGGDITANTTINVSISTTWTGGSGVTDGGVFYIRSGATLNINAGAGAKLTATYNVATARGGVFSLDNGILNINFAGYDVIFSSNSAVNSGTYGGGVIYAANSSSITINAQNLTFDSNKKVNAGSESGGGAIMLQTGSQMTINATNVIIRNNTSGQDGPAGLIKGASTLTFSSSVNSLIIENQTAVFGNSFYINNGFINFRANSIIFRNNYASGNGIGGVLATYSSRGIFTFDRTDLPKGSIVFSSNVAFAQGGVMDLNVSGDRVTFRNYYIEANNNYGASRGGIIASDAGSQVVEFINTTSRFVNNTSVLGGAIYLSAGSRVTFQDSNIEFTSNTSTSLNSQGNIAVFGTMELINIDEMIGRYNKAANGGFLYVPNLPFNFTGALMEMIGNTAFGSGSYGIGGAFYFTGSNVTFAGSTIIFSGNIANSSGGAIYLNKSTMVFNASKAMEFKYNKGAYGAVLYATNNSSVTFTSGAVLFESNISTIGNGVISWDNSAVKFTGLTSLTAIHNEAENGGFIYINGANYVLDAGIITISSNTARGDGGAIYLLNSTLTFKVSTVTMAGNQLINEGKAGGAIYMSSSIFQFELRTAELNINITSNTAYSGGVIYADKGSEIKFTNTKSLNLSYSVAVSSGGAIYADNSTITVRGEFGMIGNTANVGGGFYLSSIKFDSQQSGHTIFERNTAVSNGGAGYIEKTTMTFDGSTLSFISNRIRNGIMGKGMAVYMREGSIIDLKGGALRAIDQGRLVFKADGNFERQVEDAIFYIEDDASQVYLMESSFEAIHNGRFEYSPNQYIDFYSNGGFFELNGDGSVLSSLTFSGNYFNLVNNAGIKGGAIYADKYNLTYPSAEMYFTSNTARNEYAGGAIYMNASTITFKGNKYISMSANKSDGGTKDNDIRMIESKLNVYILDTGTFAARGGIYAEHASIINKPGKALMYLSGYNYFNNISSFGVIGQGTLKAEIGAWTYIYNQQGLYIHNSTMNITDMQVIFSSNTSIVGGAIDLRQASFGKILNESYRSMNFTYNTSKKHGGAIFLVENSSMEIRGQDISFIRNSARRNAEFTPRIEVTDGETGLKYFAPFILSEEAASRGGAIYVKKAKLTIGAESSNNKVIKFQNNEDDTGANDIYISAGELNIDNKTGGRTEIYDGIYAQDKSIISVIRQRGAGLFYLSGYNYFIDISSFGIKSDTIVDRATWTYINNDKGLYVHNASAVFQYTKADFVNNVRINEPNEFGGAIFADNHGFVEFTKESEVHFLKNSAYSGGAIYAQDGSTAIFTNGTKIIFDSNMATSSGGTIFLTRGSLMKADFNIELLEFKNSHVRDAGGAIYVDYGSTAEFR
ncbi:MAG: hypothetical protein LBT79_02930, partial [Elusimicrobiota bacterium]|nr:hypothetical protein [Elusimicrobiota bacterium]